MRDESVRLSSLIPHSSSLPNVAKLVVGEGGDAGGDVAAGGGAGFPDIGVQPIEVTGNARPLEALGGAAGQPAHPGAAVFVVEDAVDAGGVGGGAAPGDQVAV